MYSLLPIGVGSANQVSLIETFFDRKNFPKMQALERVLDFTYNVGVDKGARQFNSS